MAGGFDGTALFYEDVFRAAPFDPTVSIPGGHPHQGIPAASRTQRTKLSEATPLLTKVISPAALEAARRYRERIKKIPLWQQWLSPETSDRGSNWWIVSGAHTDSGFPMLASDPHLSLSSPPVWYEAHLIVDNDPVAGPMNINGVTFAGTPGIVLGCNERLCWGATVNPLDVTDWYAEELELNPSTGVPEFTILGQGRERLLVVPQTYRANVLGDGLVDYLVPMAVPPEAQVTLIVPRRNYGPLVSVMGTTGISVQFTGWRATRELDTFRLLARARNLDEFKQALQFFDFGSQNFAYADVDGNIAYFTSCEVPLREDLQLLGRFDGTPPFLIRDGTHRRLNEWLPVEACQGVACRQPEQVLNYEILPFNEMPQIVNPAQGFIANANQDPIGLTLDNDPLNQFRPGGGIYYLNVGYDGGFRMGADCAVDSGGHRQWGQDLRGRYDEVSGQQSNARCRGVDALYSGGSPKCPSQ